MRNSSKSSHSVAWDGRFCTHIQQHDGIPGIRRIQGVLALAKKHGPVVVDDAAKAALEIGVPTYRFVRKYVDRRPPVDDSRH